MTIKHWHITILPGVVEDGKGVHSLPYADVSIATLEKLAQALNCDVSELYERVDD